MSELFFLLGMDRVIPVAMETTWNQTDSCHLFVRDLLAFRILPFVEFASDQEAPFCSSRGDQVHDHRQTDQGTPTPVRADVGKQPVLDLVPLARAEWKVRSTATATAGLPRP